MIIAKAVIPNQYWILKQDDRKVGNIEAGPDGFQVRINNEVQKYKTINTIKQRVHIDFENVARVQAAAPTNEVNGYPTSDTPYNAIYDVKHQVPLWTREPRSKSWFTAGWYRVHNGRTWSVVQCPKLIMLERYTYKGPFRTKEEASQA
jgi:hypothetical protein